MKMCPECNNNEGFFQGKVFGITLTNSDNKEMIVSISINICSECGYKKCSILN